MKRTVVRAAQAVVLALGVVLFLAASLWPPYIATDQRPGRSQIQYPIGRHSILRPPSAAAAPARSPLYRQYLAETRQLPTLGSYAGVRLDVATLLVTYAAILVGVGGLYAGLVAIGRTRLKGPATASERYEATFG